MDLIITKRRKVLNDLLRIIPGWENLSDKEVEQKAYEEFQKLEVTEPMYRKGRNRAHTLDDEETPLSSIEFEI